MTDTENAAVQPSESDKAEAHPDVRAAVDAAVAEAISKAASMPVPDLADTGPGMAILTRGQVRAMNRHRASNTAAVVSSYHENRVKPRGFNARKKTGPLQKVGKMNRSAHRPPDNGRMSYQEALKVTDAMVRRVMATPVSSPVPACAQADARLTVESGKAMADKSMAVAGAVGATKE